MHYDSSEYQRVKTNKLRAETRKANLQKQLKSTIGGERLSLIRKIEKETNLIKKHTATLEEIRLKDLALYKANTATGLQRALS